MKTLARLAAVAAVVASAFIAAPAQADDYAPSATPEIAYPVYRAAGTPAEGDAVVQLEASGKAWGIRSAARRFDAAVPGLTINTTGTCAANPTAYCVRVEVGTYDEAKQAAVTQQAGLKWLGLCVCNLDGQARTLLLNREHLPSGSKFIKRETAAHELAHALGLGHHTARGVVSTKHTGYGMLSDAEVAVLTEWYSIPRFAA